MKKRFADIALAFVSSVVLVELAFWVGSNDGVDADTLHIIKRASVLNLSLLFLVEARINRRIQEARHED